MMQLDWLSSLIGDQQSILSNLYAEAAVFIIAVICSFFIRAWYNAINDRRLRRLFGEPNKNGQIPIVLAGVEITSSCADQPVVKKRIPGSPIEFTWYGDPSVVSVEDVKAANLFVGSLDSRRHRFHTLKVDVEYISQIQASSAICFGLHITNLVTRATIEAWFEQFATLPFSTTIDDDTFNVDAVSFICDATNERFASCDRYEYAVILNGPNTHAAGSTDRITIVGGHYASGTRFAASYAAHNWRSMRPKRKVVGGILLRISRSTGSIKVVRRVCL